MTTEIDARTATATEMLAHIHERFADSLAGCNEILDSYAAYERRPGRTEFERKAVQRSKERLEVRAMAASSSYWLEEIEALGPDPSEVEADALIRRMRPRGER